MPSPRWSANGQFGASCTAAWSLKHKLFKAMLERDAECRLTGVIEIDDVYRGEECRGKTLGRGSFNKTCSSARWPTHDGDLIALRMSAVKGFCRHELSSWNENLVRPDSMDVSYSLGCFRSVATVGVEPQPVVIGGGADSIELGGFRWLDAVLDNVTNAPHGTHHSI